MTPRGSQKGRRRPTGATLAILYERHAITTPRARLSVTRQARKAAPNGSTSAAAGMTPLAALVAPLSHGARAWRSMPESPLL